MAAAAGTWVFPRIFVSALVPVTRLFKSCQMKKGRLEAFSDGVIAIIITIMVLEMKAPQETTEASLLPVLPVFLSYILSFIYVAIYWINHHHVVDAVETIGTKVLLANLHLLFWLSLIPFATSWLGENHLATLPVALYGGVLLMCSVAFRILELTLLGSNHDNQKLHKAFRDGYKEKVSMILYLLSIPLAYLHIGISIFIYVFVAVIWISPARAWKKAFAIKE